MPTAEYARDRLLAALRPPLSGADYCVSLAASLGRYWSALLHPLASGGRTVAVVGALPKADYYDPHGLGRLPLELPRVTFSLRPPRRIASTTLLTDDLTGELAQRPWNKVLQVSVATETMLADAGPHYRMPFPIFPGYAARGWEPRFVAQRDSVRTTKVLFAGNTDRALYDERTPQETRRLHGYQLSRCAALDVLRGELAAADLVVAESEAELGRAYDGSCAGRALVAGWSGYRDEEWIRVLGATDFFLALPGVFMPMSHNIIEALAAGCVPITSYPRWFSPALIDGTNCLVYDDAASLVRALRRALEMGPADVERMRSAAADYYDSHLAPGVVASRLAGLPGGATVYVQTENSKQTALIQRGSVGFPG